MKNVVLCFDQMRHHPDVGDGTNAAALFRLLDESEHQTGWYHTGTPRRARQRDALADARTTVRKAYAFVVRNFEPDDRILVFGTGRGGYCAQALTRLLGTVGILPPRWDDLVDFFVSAYGLPRLGGPHASGRGSRSWPPSSTAATNPPSRSPTWGCGMRFARTRCQTLRRHPYRTYWPAGMRWPWTADPSAIG